MKSKVLNYIKDALHDTYEIFLAECQMVYRDKGVMIIFGLAGFIYPLLYNLLYMNETVTGMPIAVVDQSASSESRQFIRELDATPEVDVAFSCQNVDEARRLMEQRKINGIVLFPSDYSLRLAAGEQATLSTYADMSSFLYYKNLLMATNYVMLDEMKNIQLKRYAMAGYVGESAQQLVTAVPYEANVQYNPGFGYSSFFVPAILMVIIQQTLFLGIAMVCGTSREEGRTFSLPSTKVHARGISRVMLGKGAAYFLFYLVLTAYIAGVVPRLFNLPHIGNIWQVYKLLLPYITACIFFSFTCSIFIKHRENGFVLFLFFSVILLFLSGFSWPQSNIPQGWRWFSYLFPSTFAVQGFIKLNSMGAEIRSVEPEIMALVLQTILYFVTACISIGIENHIAKRHAYRLKKMNYAG